MAPTRSRGSTAANCLSREDLEADAYLSKPCPQAPQLPRENQLGSRLLPRVSRLEHAITRCPRGCPRAVFETIGKLFLRDRAFTQRCPTLSQPARSIELAAWSLEAQLWCFTKESRELSWAFHKWTFEQSITVLRVQVRGCLRCLLYLG